MESKGQLGVGFSTVWLLQIKLSHYPLNLLADSGNLWLPYFWKYHVRALLCHGTDVERQEREHCECSSQEKGYLVCKRVGRDALVENRKTGLHSCVGFYKRLF